MNYHNFNDFSHTPHWKVAQIIGYIIMGLSVIIFSYFFLKNNFHVYSVIAVGCFFIFFAGAFLLFTSYLFMKDNQTKSSFHRFSKRLKLMRLISLGSFWLSGLLFLIGVLVISQNTTGYLQYAIPLFILSLFALLMSGFGFINFEMTKQHYSLDKKSQEILELLRKLT